jgi:type IV pilus assembly protein PilQ
MVIPLRSVGLDKTFARFHLCQHWLAFMLAIVAPTIAGCKNHGEIKKRTVQDLYHEALRSAASRPGIIQPAVSSSGAMLVPLPYGSPPGINGPTTNGSGIHNFGKCDGLAQVPVPDSVERNAQPASLSVVNAVHLSGLPLPNSMNNVVTAAFYQQASEVLINELFDQTDIREAIQILAGYAKAAVIVDETIGGVTSAQIVDDTFENALQKILMPLGLVYAKSEDRYIIAPPDPDSPLFSYISSRVQFSPSHHEVASLASLLPVRFKKYVQTSPERNILIIDAPTAILEEIQSRLRELDQPIPQVELEAIVCVVSPDSSFRFGVDWGHVVGSGDDQSFKVGVSSLALNSSVSGQGVQDAFSNVAISSAFVRLLADEGYVTIRAAPRVTAKDGEKANISINRETFFSVQPSNANVFFRQDLQKVEAGISLEITPRIHHDMVSVAIGKAEVSEDIRSSTNSNDNSANSFPIINRRQVSTEVMVRDGHTIVIGGLVQRQTVDRVTKVPYLSRVPLLGKLFQTIEKQEQDAEVAIFITPRIVPTDPECTIQSVH